MSDIYIETMYIYILKTFPFPFNSAEIQHRSMLTWDQRHEQHSHIPVLSDRQNSSYHLYYTQRTKHSDTQLANNYLNIYIYHYYIRSNDN